MFFSSYLNPQRQERTLKVRLDYGFLSDTETRGAPPLDQSPGPGVRRQLITFINDTQGDYLPSIHCSTDHTVILFLPVPRVYGTRRNKVPFF